MTRVAERAFGLHTRKSEWARVKHEIVRKVRVVLSGGLEQSGAGAKHTRCRSSKVLLPIK